MISSAVNGDWVNKKGGEQSRLSETYMLIAKQLKFELITQANSPGRFV